MARVCSSLLLLFVPLSQKRPPQPGSQLHCQGCWQKPWRQPGIGTQRSHCSPSHPGSHLRMHTSHVTTARAGLGGVRSVRPLSLTCKLLIRRSDCWCRYSCTCFLLGGRRRRWVASPLITEGYGAPVGGGGGSLWSRCHQHVLPVS